LSDRATLITTMTKRKRRRFTPEEKTRILKLHLVEQRPVSEICEEYAISPTLFYNWQKQLFENAPSLFEGRRTGPSPLQRKDEQIRDLEARLARKNEVLSEAVEALIEAKKHNGEA